MGYNIVTELRPKRERTRGGTLALSRYGSIFAKFFVKSRCLMVFLVSLGNVLIHRRGKRVLKDGGGGGDGDGTIVFEGLPKDGYI